MANPDFKLPFNDLTELVPTNLRNPVNTSLIDNLFNRFLTHDESIPLYGYVGRKPSSTDDRTPRVPQPDAERDINSIVPVLSFKQGAERVAFTVQDLIRKAEAIGISPGSQQWLYSQGNNYLPPINLDKFTSFFNYYWVAKAVTAVPNMPWNPELLPEYYTIAAPQPTDFNKLNVVAATVPSTPIVRTGTGFYDLQLELTFTSPTSFSVKVLSALPFDYAPTTASLSRTLSTGSDHHEFWVTSATRPTKKLVEFDIVRDEIYDQFGETIGLASFDEGDKFVVSVEFLTRNYNVAFTGAPGVKGKLVHVKSLNEYQDVDGVTLRAGDRVLVKDAAPGEAGIYIVAPGAWERALDDQAVAGARTFVRGGIQNGSQLWELKEVFGGLGWLNTGVTQSNTNEWQEGNYWVRGEDLSALGLGRSDVVQAVRPIIEYNGSVQLNAFVKDGLPSDTGVPYKQVKTEFNQLPLFDLYRYDGTHAGLVSSVFYYEEDVTADLDIALQKRVMKSTNDSADFIFNHGMADEDGSLLFIKSNGELKTIWHAGFIEPTISDVTYAGAGHGQLTNVKALPFTQQQIWTITAEDESKFTVTGSKMPNVPAKAVVGEPYTNMEISFTITEGDVPFSTGDTFLVAVGSLESPRYVSRDEDGVISDLLGRSEMDLKEVGAWQVPRMFYNNPYNESREPVTEGVLYSHFRGILSNQLTGRPVNNAFGGSIKLWSEQQTLLAALLMQRDMTPISMIDLAQRQYETALNSVRDIFQQNIVQFLADNGNVESLADMQSLFAFIQSVRRKDNDTRKVLYDSTSPLIGFPITLPQMGIAPLVLPQISFDPVLGQTVLTHHDGHKSSLAVDDLDFRQAILGSLTSLQIKRSDGTYTAAIGSFTTAPTKPYKGELWVQPNGTMFVYDVASDREAPSNPEQGTLWFKRSANELYFWSGTAWVQDSNIATPWKQIDLASTLNSLLLLVELKLYEGVNPNARKYDFTDVMQDPAFLTQLEAELFSFAALNGYAPLASDYVPEDPFTWNYSQAKDLPPLNTATPPPRWHNLLKAHQATVDGVVPTERPNLEPWKLVGFTDPNEWWDNLTPEKQEAYAPYAQANDIVGLPATSVRAVQAAGSVTTLSGLQTIDGVNLSTGDRVLLANEGITSSNGIWIVSPGNWTRAPEPFTEHLVITVTSGAYKGSAWIVAAGNEVKQVRSWSNELWADIKAQRPTLRLSVNTYLDSLLPPYVSASNPQSVNALTTAIPNGASQGYEFGQDSPVETIWKRTAEYQYSLARALFRYDPLAFLGFCWGFNWVEVDGILYDGYDMNMPGHKRFRLHGEVIEPVARKSMTVTGTGTAPLILTYTAYTDERKQSFTVRQDGLPAGYVEEGKEATFAGFTFTIEDEGRPFRIGDRFEISKAGVVTFVPVTTYRYMGFGQVFTHALRETSIDTESSYAVSAFREWEVNMGYRAGGLVATDDLQVYTDSETLSDSAFDLLFKKNQIARNEWVQALRIEVEQFGETIRKETGFAPVSDGSDWTFRIEGYNPRYLGISYYTVSGSPVTFNALTGAHTDREWIQHNDITGVVHTRLPLTITGIQNVVDFLFGYSKYLEDRGWEFNKLGEFNIDAETGRKRNFQLEIEIFVDRCYAGIDVGQGHVVNPFIDRAWFNQEKGLLSEFIDTSLFDITGHPGAFDALGVKYRKSDLDVTRTNAQSSFGAAGPMFSAHAQVDEFEHIFIFNNFSQPSTGSGMLYDPFSGSRVVTYKFNGRKQATNTMRPEFGGHFLVGNEVHQNLQASTDNVANFYDPNHAFENETTTRHSLALLGFNTKKYFDDLDISNKTQFNFWRGLIQAKGTNLSIDAYLNNNRFDDAKVDEYWAYKVAEYGDARQRAFPELKLTTDDALTQFTRLQFDNTSLVNNGFRTVERFDEKRWFSIDDMDQDAYFAAEKVGTFLVEDPAEDGIYTLPFIADYLYPDDEVTFKRLNATTIRATGVGPLVVVGYGPARPRFNPIKLFNYVDNELVAEIPMWHPAVGEHTPVALESINVISSQNPAKYNYSTQVANNNTYDPLRPWGSNEVGRVWFNTKNLDYLPYYDPAIFTIDERLSRWGTLSDFATIDVYEWVQSTVPPTEYNALALQQAGNADLNSAVKAAGEVAGKETYKRSRKWQMRPIAWSYSEVPVDVDWGARPPFPGVTNEAGLHLENGLAWLDKGTFALYGIKAGMRIGAWNNSEIDPRPLSEWIIENLFTKYVTTRSGSPLIPVKSNEPPVTIAIELTDTNFTGELYFYKPKVHSIDMMDYDEDGNLIATGEQTVEVTMVIQAGNGEVSEVTVFTGSGITPTIDAVKGEVVRIPVSAFGFDIVITADENIVAENNTSLAYAIYNAFPDGIVVNDAVVVTPIVHGDFASLSNTLEAQDASIQGWRVWNIPTQAQLDADGQQPFSSWKPYVGDFADITGSLAEIQDAVSYAKRPLTLNNGQVIDRYNTTWTQWEVLHNQVVRRTQTGTGAVVFDQDFTENIDAKRASVYVNGIAQLRAAFTINGKILTVSNVPTGSTVTVIIRKYEPTPTELSFDPTIKDDLNYQQQYKQDYEYVALPVRDREGAFSSTVYYFWVKNKTTPASGKKMSVQSIAQELRDGPTNYLTFQGFKPLDEGGPYRYDAITVSGLNYIVSKDDTFKLRFTRNFTLRDEPEQLNLKNVHTEWALMRSGQKTKIPEALWQKLTDSVAGVDAAGNAIPAIRRVLYDERNGTRTQFGFGPEQTLAPSQLLRSSITDTIVNTKLVETSTGSPLPDFIPFLDQDQRDTWFADAASARKTMTDIWNSASVAQVNEVFFAALNDVLANNYELTDIFKTSRLSAYSIKVVAAPPVGQSYE